MTKIQTAALDYFQITLAALCGDSRTSGLVVARHTCQYLEHKQGRSYSEIGRDYKRDHGTIMAACKHVTARIAANDARYVEPVTALQRRLMIQTAEEVYKLNMTCTSCGISTIELMSQIREINKRLSSIEDAIRWGNK